MPSEIRGEGTSGGTRELCANDTSRVPGTGHKSPSGATPSEPYPVFRVGTCSDTTLCPAFPVMQRRPCAGR
jgi:hypothetical protein